MPDPTATTADPAIPALERSMELRASPERVWRALTEADELAAWFGQRCEIDLRPGGDAWFDWDDGGLFRARVEVVEPRRRLVVRWATERDQAVDDGPSTVMEWRLEESHGGGTVLHLRETGFTDAASRFGNVHGWMDELRDLAVSLAAEPWHAPIRQTHHLRSAPERVWEAIATIEGLDQWFGPTEGLEIRPGSTGWFVWAQHGRFAVRIEAVEPPRYLAWSWTPEPDVALEAATTVLRTEWYVAPREDGGTDLHLMESGPFDEAGWKANAGGWSSDVIAGIRKVLGEAD